MVTDGGPPPGDGYTTPDKYVPDNLGEKKVVESNGSRTCYIPVAVHRYLDVSDGDKLKFLEGGIEEKMVVIKVVEGDEPTEEDEPDEDDEITWDKIT